MALKNPIKKKAMLQSSKAVNERALESSGLLPGLEALPTVVLVLEKRKLRVAFANASAETMLDLSRKQLMQLSWPDLFTNADELVEVIDAIADNRFQATHLDAVLERPGYEPLHVHVVVGFFEAQRERAREIEEAGDEGVGAVDFTRYESGHFVRNRATACIHVLREHLGGGFDGAQGIPDFVGESRGKLPESSQALGTADFGLRLLQMVIGFG